jgi:hypothetical protein
MRSRQLVRFEPLSSVQGGDAAKERAAKAVSAGTGAPLDDVRSLFAREFARLEIGATVRAYLLALTVSSVRTILSKRRKSMAAQAGQACAETVGSIDPELRR